MGGLLHWAQQGGPGRGAALPSPLLTVLNVTANPSWASVPITVLQYDGPLLCGFNVAIKDLTAEEFFLAVCSQSACHKPAPSK